MVLIALSLMAAPALAASQEAPFEPVAQSFADAGACRLHLAALVSDARGRDYAAAEGPYAIAEGDERAHMVQTEQRGHRITEYRCQSAALSSRSWTHEMDQGEEPFTIDSVARKADWLKKDGGEKQ
ncbi:MAG TPA: hypothetical protein VGD19_00235 [Allosphingosinicella sp.]|jgi:hypothetical protein